MSLIPLRATLASEKRMTARLLASLRVRGWLVLAAIVRRLIPERPHYEIAHSCSDTAKPWKDERYYKGALARWSEVAAGNSIRLQWTSARSDARPHQ